jgi:hypothetical protein
LHNGSEMKLVARTGKSPEPHFFLAAMQFSLF